MEKNADAKKAHSKAMTKYIKKTYDRIEIRFTKDSGMKDFLLKHTQITGESVNAFIHRAILEQIDNDAGSAYYGTYEWNKSTSEQLIKEFIDMHPEIK